MQNNLKRRVLLVLPGDSLQVWSDTGIIQNMTRTCDLFILTWETTKSISIPTLNKEIQVKQISTPVQSQITRLLQLMSLVMYRSRSLSFQLVFKRMLYGDVLLHLKNLRSFSGLRYIVIRFIEGLKFLFYPRLGIISLFPVLNHFFLKLLKWVFNRQDSHILDKINFFPELIVTRSSGVESYVYEVFRDARRLKIKTAMVLENWDNLTSKSVIVTKPDFITVMGKSSIEKARKIQMLNSTQIIPAGLPRHNLIRQFRSNQNVKKYSDAPFTILYLGCSVPHNEHNLINSIVARLKNSLISENYRFIYRQHPHKQYRFGDSLELDLSVITQDNRDNTGFKRLPLIDANYMKELASADLVISTPTTMALEAMMLNKLVLIDGTVDNVHRTSSGFALRQYEHLQDLYHIKGLNICSNVDEIVDSIILEFENRTNVSYDLSFIVENSKPCFSFHLNKILTQLD